MPPDASFLNFENNLYWYKKAKITQLTDTREGREVYIELKGRFLNIV